MKPDIARVFELAVQKSRANRNSRRALPRMSNELAVQKSRANRNYQDRWVRACLELAVQKSRANRNGETLSNLYFES